MPSPGNHVPESDSSRLFNIALNNRFTVDELDTLLSSGRKPLFVYGSLMVPTVVTRVINAEDKEVVARNMTPALLTNYKRLAVTWADFPALVLDLSPGSSVHGLLLFGLTDDQRRRIESYESGLYYLTEVKVKIEVGWYGIYGYHIDGMKVIDALAYVWDGLRSELYEVHEKAWLIEEYLESCYD